MSRFISRELTFGAKYALECYAENARKEGNYKDCWLRLLSSLYASYGTYFYEFTEETDQKIKEILKEYIVEDYLDYGILNHLEMSDVDLLRDYPSVIEYCCDAYFRDIFARQEYSEPYELSVLIGKLMHFFDAESESIEMYIPFAGIGSTVMECYSPNTYSEEINELAWAISMIRLGQDYLKSKPYQQNWDITIGDSFKTLGSKDKLYDMIVFTPPFGVKNKNGYDEYDAVRMALENKLSASGSLCCVLPASFLTSNTSKQSKLRKYLLENNLIHTIISLPKIFPQYHNTSTIILILDKWMESFGVNTIRLVDGTSFITKGLKENGGGLLDYNGILSAIYEKDNKYVIQMPIKGIISNPNLLLPTIALIDSQELKNGETRYKLGDIISISSKRVHNVNVEMDNVIPMLSLDKLYDTPYNCNIELINTTNECNLKYTQKNRGEYFVYVDSPTYIVQFYNKSAKVGKISNQGKLLIRAKRNTFFFSIDKNIVLPEYLLMYLQSDKILSQTNVYKGVGLPYISEKNFLDLIVALPSVEQQREELLRTLAKDVNSFQDREEKLFDIYKQEIHTRKHALSQNISSLSSYWNKINNIRLNNNNIIDGTKYVGIVNSVQVSSILDSISNLISTVEKQVEHLADVNYDWGQPSEIKPQQLINNYIRKNTSTEFIMTSPKNKGDKNIAFYAPLRAVEHVISNIVTNAKEHGFTQSDRNDYEIAFDWFEEFGNIVILISNNGDPLKEGVTGEMVFTYGFSTMFNVNGHNGIGGSESKSIMEKFGNIEIISNPNERFPITYKLTFKNTNL